MKKLNLGGELTAVYKNKYKVTERLAYRLYTQKINDLKLKSYLYDVQQKAGKLNKFMGKKN